jgi:RNA polymerase sigma factor (sigma-70 family)
VGEYDEAAKLCEQAAGRLEGFLVIHGTPRCSIEDVMQDTFMVVARKFDEISIHPNPTAYILLIAKRIAADRRKAERSRTANELMWHLRHSHHPAEAVPRLDLDVDLQRALALLPPRQREVVYLRRCADLATDDVVSILGISAGAVKSHLRRGESRLRDLLSDGGERDDHAAG